jgi:hypothetical protein
MRQILAVEKNKPCMDCGREYPPCVMEFDHVRGEKKFEISKIKYSVGALRAELAKCELVCANCHRIRTMNRGWTVATVQTFTEQPEHIQGVLFSGFVN